MKLRHEFEPLGFWLHELMYLCYENTFSSSKHILVCVKSRMVYEDFETFTYETTFSFWDIFKYKAGKKKIMESL